MSTILVVILFVCLFLLELFRRKNRLIITKSKQYLQQMQNEISIQNSQLITRKIHLDNYHFLKYNLDDALVIQSEIKV